MTNDEIKEWLNKYGGILRTVGLLMLILGDAGFLTITFFCQKWMWFWPFVGITAIIGGAEIVGVVFFKKTISTMFRDWIIEDQGKWSWAYTALGCFAFAMSGLVLHLAVFGNMFPKKVNQ